MKFIREHHFCDSGNHSLAVVQIGGKFYTIIIDRRSGQVYGVGKNKNWYAGFSDNGVRYVADAMSRSDAVYRFKRALGC